MSKFPCEVVIPTRQLFRGEIAYADIPGADGSFGVLSNHELIVSTMRPGVVTLHLDEAGKEKKQFAVIEGAAQMIDNTLIVMARMGVDIENIDVAAVRAKAEDRRKAIEEIEKSNAEDKDSTLAVERTRLAWYELQIKVAEGK